MPHFTLENGRVPAVGNSAHSSALAEYYSHLQLNNMDALWRRIQPAPTENERRAPYPPFHWSWDVVKPAVLRSGELVEPGPDAERRVVQLINPNLGEMRTACHALTANVQMVLPGEISPSHRHSIAAIRFIIEGQAAITVVEGESIAMEPGDLVLTPAGYWHGHVNKSDGPLIWMDSLDRPVIAALRQVHQESYPGELQPLSEEQPDRSMLVDAGTLTKITNAPGAAAVSPIMRYSWHETKKALEECALESCDPFDDIVLDYTNPVTRGHVLPTIGCRIQMLRSGVHTLAHRHAYSSVYHVFRGSGTTIVDGAELKWKQGDFFVIPPWSWHEHTNSSDQRAYLFSTNDLPILNALHLQKDEVWPGDGHRQQHVYG